MCYQLWDSKFSKYLGQILQITMRPNFMGWMKFHKLYMAIIFCYVICLGSATSAAQNFSLAFSVLQEQILFFLGGLSSETGQDSDGEIWDNCPNTQTKCWCCVCVGVNLLCRTTGLMRNLKLQVASRSLLDYAGFPFWNSAKLTYFFSNFYLAWSLTQSVVWGTWNRWEE